jgi:GNAT superfamily N-acetyltransferase
VIRRAETDADRELCARIFNALDPETPIGAADFFDDPCLLLHREEGYVVVKPSSLDDAAFTMVRVLPEARRRGVGSALLAAASGEARTLGAGSLYGRVDGEDAESLGFVTRRGFVEIAREVEQVRELGDEAVPQPLSGVEIRLGAEDDLADVYTVAVEATPDMAMDAAIRAAPYERWLVQHARSTFHVALEDGRVVGFATLAPFGTLDDMLEHELTGVLRSRRRRGIARALKQTQIAWAAAEGYRRLITETQTGNEAMRSLNLQLGYRERLASIAVKGPLQ